MPKNKLELFSDRQQEKFCESLKTLFKSECSIFFEEGEADQFSPVQIEKKHKELKLNEARDSINQDSKVNQILNSLRGSKIVDITPKEPS